MIGRLTVAGLCGLYCLCCVAAEPGSDILANVAGEDITVTDLKDYARLNPIFYTRMQLPKGPRMVLDNLIAERLLALEGQRLGIPAKSTGVDHPAYALSVRDRLIDLCPQPHESQIRVFYDENPQAFSTALFLRLQRIVIPAKPDPVQAKSRLSDARARIESGEAEMGSVADEISQDPLTEGRGGDIGFLQMDPDASLMVELSQLPTGSLYGPVLHGDTVGLYRVTERREPILEAFDDIRGRVAEEQTKQCKKTAFKRLIDDIKTRWPVTIYAEQIGVHPKEGS